MFAVLYVLMVLRGAVFGADAGFLARAGAAAAVAAIATAAAATGASTRGKTAGVIVQALIISIDGRCCTSAKERANRNDLFGNGGSRGCTYR